MSYTKMMKRIHKKIKYPVSGCVYDIRPLTKKEKKIREEIEWAKIVEFQRKDDAKKLGIPTI